jgi:hypothetical protein
VRGEVFGGDVKASQILGRMDLREVDASLLVRGGELFDKEEK